MTRLLCSLLAAGLLFGCAETEECKSLKKLEREHEQALGVMRSRAGLAEKARARADKSRVKVEKMLAEFGLDLTESDLSEVMKKRGEAAKVDVARGSRTVAAGEGSATADQTVWSFELKGDVARAVDLTREIADLPPLTNFVAFLGDESGDTWRLRLGRPDIQRVEIEVKPTPPPVLESADEVASEFGFCGAGKLRAHIAEMDREMEALQSEAEKTTVALPEAASWDGLGHRARVEHAVELENRRIVNALLSAAVRADVPIKAAGVEGSVVILELRGGAKERQRFQKQLDDKILQGIKPAETERPGVARFMYVNRIAQRRAGAEGGGGPGGGEHGGH